MDTVSRSRMEEELPPAAKAPPPYALQAAEEGGVEAFFAGAGVLVTGGSGFLGALLLEKLLRACPAVGAVYLLLRPKRGEPPQRRLQRLLDDPLFARVREQSGKVVLVEGDCAAPGLGLSAASRALLQREVSVVFHCAATVRFDEPLRSAAHTNVRGTGELLRLARDMPRLQALVHFSTAYAYYPELKLDENVYESRMSAEQLLNIVDALDEKTLERISPVIMEPWPNTYTFTKAIAENLIKNEGKTLPVCIFRPSMVINTVKEPVPGWMNNVNGPAGIVLGAGVGILHTMCIDVSMVADLIPGDIVANAGIAAAWNTAITRQNPQDNQLHGEETAVYNCVSSARNAITWNNFLEYNVKYGMNYPSDHCLWYYCLFLTSSRTLHKVLRVLLHYLPALFVDTALFCAGKKPMLWRAYKKIHKFMDLTYYFGSQVWHFDDTNVKYLWNKMSKRDKELFPFNIEDVDWPDVVKNVIPGLRVYFLKDPLDTVEKSKVKYNRLKIMHYTLVAALWLLFFQLVWWTVSYFI